MCVCVCVGMDYVPPCVYRKEMDVDWQHFNGGTFMYCE